MGGWTVQVLSGRIAWQPQRETMRLQWIAVFALSVACSSGDNGAVLLDVTGTMDGGMDGASGLDTRGPDAGALDAAADSDTRSGDTGCGDSCAPDWACEPGGAMCQGNSVTYCLEDGSGWTVAEPCPKLTTCE